MYISILAVLADRDGAARQQSLEIAISILAVLADRDALPLPVLRLLVLFQSSRSLRTATRRSGNLGRSHTNFNPRGPCGPRLRD